jgi:hypothetical protein
VVILLNFHILLAFLQGYSGLVAALQARYDDVRLPFLPYPHAAVLTMNEKRVAPLARTPTELEWEADFGCHSDFSGSHDVARGQGRVRFARGIRLFEEDLNALFGDLLRGRLHPEPSPAAPRRLHSDINQS